MPLNRWTRHGAGSISGRPILSAARRPHQCVARERCSFAGTPCPAQRRVCQWGTSNLRAPPTEARGTPRPKPQLRRMDDGRRRSSVLAFPESRMPSMSCERGRTLHAEFTRAVTERAAVESVSHLNLNGETKLAKKREDVALLNRTIHISGCGECWARPPQ